jgi:UPF0755 protein
MSKYVLGRLQRRPRGRGWVQFLVLGFLVVLGISFVVWFQSYARNLRPVSADTTEKVFVVSSGTSVSKIATDLHDAGLIRKSWAFERYVSDTRIGNKLQAGTYKLSPAMSTQKIAKAIADGKVAVDLITILPGQRIDQVRQALINAKFDTAAVDAALLPAQYSDIGVVANIPAGATLEGFLYPDSYQKDATTDPAVIVRLALKEMEAHLTPDIANGFKAQGLSVFQGVTLASVVEREVSNPDDRTQVAQVFLKRIRDGKRLESDVTAFYGAIQDGQEPLVSYPSPYNTYKVDGLPAGPISNVSENSLRAVAAPATTDWLYFVAGDDGKTYFSRTLADHEALTAQHCKKLCGN